MSQRIKFFGYIIIAVLIVLLTLYLIFPAIATHYINKEINKIQGYSGEISDVDFNLLDGTYSITGLKLDKDEADSNLPFVNIKTILFTIQWGALFNGAIVSEIDIHEPRVNFAKGKAKESDQFGRGVDWIERVQAFMPININRLTIHDGELRYIDDYSTPTVDIALYNLGADARNLRNVSDMKNPLPSSIRVDALMVGGGELVVDGKVNILKEVPDVDINGSLEKVNLPALNDFLKAYANIDAERGEFNVYVEMVINDAKLDGYVKPLIKDLQVLSFANDKEKPLQLIWEGVVGFFSEVLENQKKDQFASKVPIEGTLDNVKVGVFSTIINIVSNAFIVALKGQTDDEIDFSDTDENSNSK